MLSQLSFDSHIFPLFFIKKTWSRPSNNFPRIKPYTYAGYMTWQFDERVELIKEKVFNMSPAPASKHQRIVGNLYLLIGNFLWKQRCKVYIAPLMLDYQNPTMVL